MASTSTNNAIIDINTRPWHSPSYVLWSLDQLILKYGEIVGTKREFQKAREARAVALLLLGINKTQGLHYMMQISDDNSPDIRSIRLVERPNQPTVGEIQDVEVVTFGNYSDGEVADFIINKKLNSKKAYDDKTIILCEVIKRTNLQPYVTMYEKMKSINPLPTIFVLGKISPEQDRYVYQICQIWPSIDYLEDIDVLQQVKTYPAPHNLMLNHGPAQIITYTKSGKAKPTPYEVFGLNEQELVKKYG